MALLGRSSSSMLSAPLLLLLAVLLCSTSTLRAVRASEGDESALFQQCLGSCLATGCTKTPGSSNTCDTVCPHSSSSSSSNQRHHSPWTLRLMQWDCASDCAYHCMWALEAPKAAAAAAAAEPVHKYYGKWPFVRVLGAQEIASVLFSIANLLAHVHCLHTYLQQRRFRQQQQRQQQPVRHRGHKPGLAAAGVAAAGAAAGAAGGAAGSAGGGAKQQQGCHYPFHGLWVAYAAVNINAWLWSSVFHCRDTRVTERLDYFSADLAVVVGCGVVAARTLQLTSPRRLALLAVLLGAGLLQHVHYMAFVKFDYGYNVALCIALGLATAAAWLAWAARSRHPGRSILYRFMALVHAAMLLEVLDFPPLLRLFDAHALWHAATVPLTYLWYRFIAADVAAWESVEVGGEEVVGGGADSTQKQKQ